VYGRLIVVLVALAPYGCGPRTLPPLTPPPVVVAHDGRVRDLQRDLATILDAPVLRHGVLAVCVKSLTRGDELFRYHADTLVMPASNMKLVTLAVAADRLGWDFTFETAVVSTGTLDAEGVLHGDLVLRGSGDPSLGVGDTHAEPILDRWAQTLFDQGIRRIDGRLIGDDQVITGTGLGAGWSWDYLSAGYAAPVGGLQVNENAAQVTMTPSQTVGQPATVVLTPPESGLTVVGSVTTAPAGSAVTVSLDRTRGDTVVRATGSIPVGPEVVRYAAVDRPALYASRMFASALSRRGISVRDGIVTARELAGPLSPDPAETVRVRYQSPPLRELAVTMMKNSSNLYAETLLATLGRTPGQPAAFDRGRAAILEQLTTWDLRADAVVVADGSGLSRYDYVTADTIVSVLSRMYQDARHKDPWLASLPVAGVDGTMRERFKGSAAAGQVRAKTGTISNVRALSGYVPAAGGEWLVFSMIVNNVTGSGAEITGPIDRAVNRLAAFRR
jgi:D-alanyl-D-alanine carboxypeptidase/D-alanyl-D-alanine-endopeptidase (penicillin-binding protein 4)